MEFGSKILTLVLTLGLIGAQIYALTCAKCLDFECKEQGTKQCHGPNAVCVREFRRGNVTDILWATCYELPNRSCKPVCWGSTLHKDEEDIEQETCRCCTDLCNADNEPIPCDLRFYRKDSDVLAC